MYPIIITDFLKPYISSVVGKLQEETNSYYMPPDGRLPSYTVVYTPKKNLNVIKSLDSITNLYKIHRRKHVKWHVKDLNQQNSCHEELLVDNQNKKGEFLK